jgi:hypothetical protein
MAFQIVYGSDWILYSATTSYFCTVFKSPFAGSPLILMLLYETTFYEKSVIRCIKTQETHLLIILCPRIVLDATAIGDRVFAAG